MTEHEQLKWICDEIGYDTTDLDFIDVFGIIRKREGEVGFRILNVREIIFTQEFMDKYNLYEIKKILGGHMPNVYGPPKGDRMGDLLNHLDNPVEYLYNLIK